MKKDTSPEIRVARECLAGRVRTLNRVVTGIYDEAFRPHGVRISQLNILVCIAAIGEVRAAEVCSRLRLDKSTLSRDLDRLLEHGWIQATPGTGRIQELQATDSGRELIRSLMPAWEEAQKRVRDLLGTALTGQICETMDRLRVAGKESA